MTGNGVVQDEVEGLIHNRRIPDRVQHIQRAVRPHQNWLGPPGLAGLTRTHLLFEPVRRDSGAFYPKADSTGDTDVETRGKNKAMLLAFPINLRSHDEPDGLADRPRPPVSLDTAPGYPAVERRIALAIGPYLKLPHRTHAPP